MTHISLLTANEPASASEMRAGNYNYIIHTAGYDRPAMHH